MTDTPTEQVILARLVAAERRIKHLETCIASLETGVAGLRGRGAEPRTVGWLYGLNSRPRR